jgi:hypothetical protein
MKKRIRYGDEPIGPIRIEPDFLPLPEALAFRDVAVKVTLALSKRSVDFFKRAAKQHGAPYQRMIRRLVDAYVDGPKKSAQVKCSGISHVES